MKKKLQLREHNHFSGTPVAGVKLKDLSPQSILLVIETDI
jgi:hypothetical protein